MREWGANVANYVKNVWLWAVTTSNVNTCMFKIFTVVIVLYWKSRFVDTAFVCFFPAGRWLRYCAIKSMRMQYDSLSPACLLSALVGTDSTKLCKCCSCEFCKKIPGICAEKDFHFRLVKHTPTWCWCMCWRVIGADSAKVSRLLTHYCSLKIDENRRNQVHSDPTDVVKHVRVIQWRVFVISSQVLKPGYVTHEPKENSRLPSRKALGASACATSENDNPGVLRKAFMRITHSDVRLIQAGALCESPELIPTQYRCDVCLCATHRRRLQSVCLRETMRQILPIM